MLITFTNGGHRPCAFFWILGLPAIGAIGLHAQTAPPAAETDSVVLNPFVISTERDKGFAASTSLAGGRLSGDLRNTAADYSVLTREFIDALNISDLTEASRWTVNSYIVEEDQGNAFAFGNREGNRIRLRGVEANDPQIDFFSAKYDYDSYNIERFDYARGANSILFGTGSFGGTANAVLKKAQIGKSSTNARLTVGSWEKYRATLDINQPITRTLAVRVNGLWEDAESWRENEFTKREAAAIALTYRPFRNTNITLNADTGRFRRNVAFTNLNDLFSGWQGDTFTTRLDTAASFTTALQNRGVTRYGSNIFILDTSGATNSLVHYVNVPQTRSGGIVGTNYTTINGVIPVGSDPGFSGQDILNTLNRPDGSFDFAYKNSQLRPFSRKDNFFTRVPSFEQNYKTFTGIVNQQIGEHYFVEGAFNYTSAPRYSQAQPPINVFIDINRFLPESLIAGGTPVANPNFLKAYSEANFGQFDQPTETTNYRVAAAAAYDKTRLGSFRFSVMAGSSVEDRSRVVYAFVFNDPTIDVRQLVPLRQIRYRYYQDQIGTKLNQPLPSEVRFVDPLSGRTATVSTRKIANNWTANKVTSEYVQAALSSSHFKDRLHLLAATRRDFIDTKSYTSPLQGSNNLSWLSSMPADWDGRALYYRPQAPSDWANLTYTPKDANGNPTGPAQPAQARPRGTNGAGLPQYANDRFQDDYSPPRRRNYGNTYSLGGVYHVLPWFSVTGSYGETFNPPGTSQRIDLSLQDPEDADTTSYGVRLSLPNNVATLNISRYKGTRKNVSVGVSQSGGLPVNLAASLVNIINANKAGDNSTSGINQRGIEPITTGISDSLDRTVEGFEFELVANPMRGLRVTANVALPKAEQVSSFPTTRAWIASRYNTLKGIITDTGAELNQQDIAFAPAEATLNSPDQAQAITAWNELQTALRFWNDPSAAVLDQPQVPKLTANMFVDYEFQTGWRKGIRVGLGANYRGKAIIGYRGADTIVNPDAPTTTIDDPRFTNRDYVYNKYRFIMLSTLGYEWKLTRKVTARVDLKIDNLLDNDDVVYQGVIQRAPNGNITSPARVATPVGANYTRPRSWELSSTFSF